MKARKYTYFQKGDGSSRNFSDTSTSSSPDSRDDALIYRGRWQLPVQPSPAHPGPVFWFWIGLQVLIIKSTELTVRGLRRGRCGDGAVYKIVDSSLGGCSWAVVCYGDPLSVESVYCLAAAAWPVMVIRTQPNYENHQPGTQSATTSSPFSFF